jgi:hypothetical protein
VHGRLRSVALAAVLLGLAACGAPEPPAAAAPPPPAPPPAADGTDLAACRDGTCEVRVESAATIPLDERYGMSGIAVTSVANGAVVFSTSLTRSSSFDTDCPGAAPNCASGSVTTKGKKGVDPAAIQITAPVGYVSRFPALTVEPRAVVGSAAVLRVAHPEPVDGTDLGACRDGTCALRVDGPATIPLDPALGAGPELRVAAISGETVRLNFRVPVGSDLRVACGGDDLVRCPTTAKGGRVDSTVLLGGEVVLPRLRITPAAVDGGSAVLRLVPATPS